MKRTNLRIVICLLSLSILFSLTGGCSQEEEKNLEKNETMLESIKNLDPATLTFYFFENGKPDQREVLDTIEQKTKDILNIKLNIEYFPFGSFYNNLRTISSSNMDFDAFMCHVPDYTMLDLGAMARRGELKDITELLPQYAPNLSSQLLEELPSVTIYGKVIAIPSKYPMSYRNYAIVREDLREKYNIPEIKTYEDYEIYLETIHKNVEGIAAGKIIPAILRMIVGKYDYEVLDYLNCIVYKKNDPDMKAIALEDIPEYKNTIRMLINWGDNGYLNEDETLYLWTVTYNLMLSGKVSSCIASESDFGGMVEPIIMNMNNSIKMIIPNARFKEYLLYPDRTFQRLSPLGDWYSPGAIAFNAKSNDVERVIMFVEWLNQDQKNYDLFMYGIEGKHYFKKGDIYEPTEGTSHLDNPYINWQGRTCFRNINMEHILYYGDQVRDNYISSISEKTRYGKCEGFYVNYSPIESEINQRSNCLVDSINIPLKTGILTMDDLDNAIQDLKDVGSDKIVNEYQRQLDDWEKNKK